MHAFLHQTERHKDSGDSNDDVRNVVVPSSTTRAAHCSHSHRCVCEFSSAALVDLLSRANIRRRQGLDLVFGVLCEDGHDVPQTLATRRAACRRQVESDCGIIGVRVAWVELVGDCVGKTVVARLVAPEAGGLVDWLVRDEAGMGLNDQRILILIVDAAARCGDERRGERGHHGLADWE